MAYKQTSKTAAEIGRELGADYILETIRTAAGKGARAQEADSEVTFALRFIEGLPLLFPARHTKQTSEIRLTRPDPC